jgi:hypothetical protein
VAWNFIIKLPELKKLKNNAQYNSILIITNKLTKFGYFLPYKKSNIIKELAYIFLKRIVANHGLLKKIFKIKINYLS